MNRLLCLHGHSPKTQVAHNTSKLLTVLLMVTTHTYMCALHTIPTHATNSVYHTHIMRTNVSHVHAICYMQAVRSLAVMMI
jgi:hypothetical protein